MPLHLFIFVSYVFTRTQPRHLFLTKYNFENHWRCLTSTFRRRVLSQNDSMWLYHSMINSYSECTFFSSFLQIKSTIMLSNNKKQFPMLRFFTWLFILVTFLLSFFFFTFCINSKTGSDSNVYTSLSLHNQKTKLYLLLYRDC